MSIAYKKSIVINILMNLIGSLAITGATQLIAFPIITNKIGIKGFGTVLTILGITNVIGVVLGGTISNIQLIKNQEYTEDGIKGDFKFLILFSLIFSFLVTLGATYFIKSQLSLLEWLSLPLISCLVLLRSYLSVYYRLKLNYLFLMVHMICAAVGYLVALPIFNLITFWPFVFILGELFAFIFAIKTTDFLKEPNIKTVRFKSTLGDVLQLGFSNLISNLLLYLDRLIINPILGPAEVSIYYMATFVGKMVGVVFQPVSGVTLSYLSVMPKRSGKQIYILMGVACFLLGIIVLIAAVPLSSIVIHILYPNSVYKVSKYFFIANLGAALGLMGTLFQPVILRYCPVYWQMVIQIIYLLVYFLTGIIYIKIQGLYGFCIAAVLANAIRLGAFLLVGYFYIIKPNRTYKNNFYENKIS